MKINNENINMKINPELAKAIVNASLELEQFFYENYRHVYDKNNEQRRLERSKGRKTLTPLVTIGSKEFDIPDDCKNLCKWFLQTRNAIIHYGNDDTNIMENKKLRDETTPEEIEEKIEKLLIILKNAEGIELSMYEKLMAIGEIGKRYTPPKRERSKIKGSCSVLSTSEKASCNTLGFSDQGVSQETICTPREVVRISNNKSIEFDNSSIEHKVVTIKEPILVSDLAKRLGAQCMVVNADLIKLGVFAAPNQPIEPEIAAKICEIHGYTFELGN